MRQQTDAKSAHRPAIPGSAESTLAAEAFSEPIAIAISLWQWYLLATSYPLRRNPQNTLPKFIRSG